jgi:hypothetical protein
MSRLALVIDCACFFHDRLHAVHVLARQYKQKLIFSRPILNSCSQGFVIPVSNPFHCAFCTKKTVDKINSFTS